MTPEEKQTNAALDAAVKVFENLCPRSRKLFFAAIPTERCETPQTLVRTDCATDGKQLAGVLRTLANHYHPQN